VTDGTEAPPSWSTLWLPLRARRATWIAAGAVLLYYLLTMSRDLSFYDSAELAMVAAQGGLGHPLGQPLHTMLGWVFARIPGVPTLVGLNLLSALPAALAVVPLVSLAEALLGPDGEDAPRWLRSEIALPAGVALLALHPALWENATRIEVYSLAMFFALWTAARFAAIFAPRGAHVGGWLGAGVALGLCASVNAVIALSTALALAPVLALAAVRRRVAPLDVVRGAGGGLLGLLPFLYLPLVAGRKDVFVWGAPTGGEALRRFLTNADFVHNQGITAAGIWHNFTQWLGWGWDHLLLPVVVTGLVAHGLWGKRAGIGRGFAALSLGLGVLMLVQNVIFWPAIPDYQGYLSVPVAVLGAGACALVVRIAALGGRRQLLAGALGVALLGSVLISAPAVYERTRHRDRVARVMAGGALDSAPPKAVIIVQSDHWAWPLLYLHEVERRRPDVVVLPTGLSGASWYWAHLYHRHGSLKKFAIRGPGGKEGRIRRFLAAQGDRPVLYERWQLAPAVGRRPGCGGAWLAADRRTCRGAYGKVEDRSAGVLDKLSRAVGEGSAPAAVIARVALERGEVLWRLGRPAAALRVLRAGVPPARRPAKPRTDVSAVGALRGPPLRWKRRVLIGHYSRCLYLAGKLLWKAGDKTAAQAHVRAAAAAGLTEARRGFD